MKAYPSLVRAKLVSFDNFGLTLNLEAVTERLRFVCKGDFLDAPDLRVLNLKPLYLACDRQSFAITVFKANFV